MDTLLLNSVMTAKAAIYVTGDRYISAEVENLKAERDGFSVVATYSDPPQPAYPAIRTTPGLAMMLNDMRIGERFSIIYVHRFTRVGNDLNHILAVINEATRLQVPMVIAGQRTLNADLTINKGVLLMLKFFKSLPRKA